MQAILLLSAALMMLVGQVNAQSMPSVEDEETPIFNFPRQIGNVWVYEENWTPCIQENRCVKTRKELIDKIEVDGVSCSVFELSTGNRQNRREFTWCFEDNKIYWPRTDIDPDTNRVDLVADFGQQVGHMWLVSNIISPLMCIIEYEV